MKPQFKHLTLALLAIAVLGCKEVEPPQIQPPISSPTVQPPIVSPSLAPCAMPSTLPPNLTIISLQSGQRLDLNQHWGPTLDELNSKSYNFVPSSVSEVHDWQDPVLTLNNHSAEPIEFEVSRHQSWRYLEHCPWANFTTDILQVWVEPSHAQPKPTTGEQLALAMAEDLARLAPAFQGSDGVVIPLGNQLGLLTDEQASSFVAMPLVLTEILSDVLVWAASNGTQVGEQILYPALSTDSSALHKPHYQSGRLQLTADGQLFVSDLIITSGQEQQIIGFNAELPTSEVDTHIQLTEMNFGQLQHAWHLSTAQMTLAKDDSGLISGLSSEQLVWQLGGEQIVVSNLDWQSLMSTDQVVEQFALNCQSIEQRLKDFSWSIPWSSSWLPADLCQEQSAVNRLAHQSSWLAPNGRPYSYQSNLALLHKTLELGYGFNFMQTSCDDTRFPVVCGSNYYAYQLDQSAEMVTIQLNEIFGSRFQGQDLQLQLAGELSVANDQLTEYFQYGRFNSPFADYQPLADLSLDFSLLLDWSDVSLVIRLTEDGVRVLPSGSDGELYLSIHSNVQDEIVAEFVYQDEVVGELSWSDYQVVASIAGQQLDLGNWLQLVNVLNDVFNN